MDKTVAEIAEILNISKQALEKRLSRTALKNDIAAYIQTVDGVKHITEEGQLLIFEHAEKNKSKTKKDPSIDVHSDASTDTSIPADATNMIKFLQDQLIEKDRQIERLQNSHEIDQQLLIQSKAQISMLQAPKLTLIEKIFGQKTQN